jgi:hypothetical protein
MKTIDPMQRDNEIWKLKIAKIKAISMKKDIPSIVEHILNNSKNYNLEEINSLGVNVLFPPNNQWRKTLERITIRRLELLTIIRDNGNNTIDPELLKEIVSVLNETKLLSINNLKYHLVNMIVYVHALSGQITKLSICSGYFTGLKELKLPIMFNILLNRHNVIIGKVKNSNADVNIDVVTENTYRLIISKHVLMRRLNDYLGEIPKTTPVSDTFVTRFLTIYHRSINNDTLENYLNDIETHSSEIQELTLDIQEQLENLQ